MHRLTARLRPAARVAVVVLLVVVISAFAWPQWGFNSQHSGNNTQESFINLYNASTLHQLYRVPLLGVADGAPAYLDGVVTSGGLKNVLFVTTKAGHIEAIDSQTGGMIWSHQYGPNGCNINNQRNVPCITTSSPAIDPNHLFVYSYGLDGFVHKYQVGDGTEITNGGWPELATLKRWDEKGSSALSLATTAGGVSYLYVTHASYDDLGDWQGHVTAINLATGTQNVFNNMCSDKAVHFASTSPDCAGVGSSIWARGGVTYDPDTDKIYLATGNGPYSPTVHYWGDTVLSLNPDGTGAGGSPLDSYTPTNFQALQAGDLDIGSTGPAILPNTSRYPHLAVQGGKEGIVRLINLDNMSGQGGPGFAGGEIFSSTLEGGGGIVTMPAVWVNPADSSTWVFYGNYHRLSGLKLSVDGGGNPSLAKIWNNIGPSTSPIVANGVLFVAELTNGIFAFNPVTGAQLWHDGSLGGVHWESPIVANGVVYITDETGNLTAYTPNGVVMSPTPTATNTMSLTPTATNTNPPKRTATATNSPIATPTRTQTSTATGTPTPTATNTMSPTPTATNTMSPTPTATNTRPPKRTATATNSPIANPTITPTPTPTATPTKQT